MGHVQMQLNYILYTYIYIYVIPAQIPGLRRHGDERTCQQVLRAKHPLTTSAFYLGLGTQAEADDEQS